ncbi:MAG: SLC13 family permease [Cyclobacteriaceae bacterium]|nr:SLC13 family permease [Cyclobacteriaceae bacterium]
MEFTLIQGLVLAIVALLVTSLYKEWLNPALSFFIAVLALLLLGVINPTELLKGLSNQQIIVIFLLILVTAGIRSVFGSEFFARLFSTSLKPKAFLLRMMMISSSISAFLNNTPIVAFLIPYVKDWADRTGTPASKFLIPLSYATILGGMITVIGTSTNLVLVGLMAEYGIPILGFKDFLYLGILVTLAGWAYIYFIGYRLLPDNVNKLDTIRQNLKEYIVETEIFHDSKLIGKTVKDAGLRNLQDLFLVEIIRGDAVISPVAPEEKLESGDTLFFSGHTESIYDLIHQDNGLRIPKQEGIEAENQFNFIEAIIPAGSSLIGMRIKDSDFRNKFNSSIVAMHRDGKRISGKVGEMHIAGGDFMLLLSGEKMNASNHEKDLFYLSVPKKVEYKKPVWKYWVGAGSFLMLLAGIVGIIPLFTASLLILSLLIFLGILDFQEIRRQLDFGLLMVLVCSLAIGIALEKSGSAALVATMLIKVGGAMGPIAVLSALFIVTIFLTALVTNPAAVSIMFPIAMSLSEQLSLPPTPFFVAIAFAASGDFMTPIGYQTNLMVYGPGGYTFKDFVRVGTPLTIIYIITCVAFISWYYNV